METDLLVAALAAAEAAEPLPEGIGRAGLAELGQRFRAAAAAADATADTLDRGASARCVV